MASVLQHWALGTVWPVTLSAAVVLGASAARANDAIGTLERPCPRIASPVGQAFLQPTRLLPSQVKAKNNLGCLSPADAVYGPDGCPVRYCGAEAGAFPLPTAPAR